MIESIRNDDLKKDWKISISAMSGLRRVRDGEIILLADSII